MMTDPEQVTANPEPPVTFLVGIDPVSGRERRASHPPDEFLRAPA